MPKPLKHLKFSDLIIDQDQDFTFINKPPFLSSLEDRNDPSNVLQLARKEIPEAQVCHRLDKETSGLLVIANHNEAYKHFAGLLENREVKKVYHAVVDGKRQFDNLECDEPILTTSTKSRVDFQRGKPSLTLVQTLEIFKQQSLIKCFPVTGRMHQIRAHLTHHESPIVQDVQYGGSDVFLSSLKRNFNQKKWEEERTLIERTALHSHQIAFRNLKNENQEVIAEYPKDFSVLLKVLRKYN